MRPLTLLLLAGLLSLGAHAEPAEVALPLHKAWFEGQVVHYVTTDISDAAMAREAGVNYVPRLADALPAQAGQRSLVARVYKFVGGEQDTVFPTIPRPLGPGNADASYSPLWQLVEVRWSLGTPPRLLTSEEAVLDAEERGQLRLTLTRIVINCPVVRSASGGALRGVR